jgi:hypothetical protein
VKPPPAVSDYMAKIGKKGGEAKGKRKARPQEHYAKMVKARGLKKRPLSKDKG